MLMGTHPRAKPILFYKLAFVNTQQWATIKSPTTYEAIVATAEGLANARSATDANGSDGVTVN